MKWLIYILLLTAALAYGGYAVVNGSKQPLPVATASENPVPSTDGLKQDTVGVKTTADEQARLMAIAYEKGKSAGFKNPEVVQGLLLQETLAGGMNSYRVANSGPQAYFGPMQIKLGAAKDVLQRNPHLYEKYGFHTKTDEEIKAFLILNEKFNIEVGALYLRVLHKEYGYSGRKLLNAYNRGPGGVKSVGDDFHYAVGAERKLALWKAKRTEN